MVRYGFEHITFATLFDTRFTYFGLSYPQPTTVSTTHVFIDGGNVFASRSDGRIIKGMRPIWDKEFNYQDPKSVQLLNISSTDSERLAQYTTDGLFLKGTSVRI